MSLEQLLMNVRSSSKINEWLTLDEDLYNKIQNTKSTYQEFISYIQKYGLEANNIIINTNKVFYWAYVYVKNGVYVELLDLNIEQFEFLQIDKRIEYLTINQDIYIQEKKYHLYFACIPDDFKLYEFEINYDNILEEDRYDIFRYIYVKIDFINENWNTPFFIKMLNDIKNERHKRNKKVTIYRGEGSLSTSHKKALSWTTNIDIAKKFMHLNESETNYALFKAVVNDLDIIDYIDDREEDEVLIFAQDIKNVEVIE